MAYVVDGEGYFEMACPHISNTRKEKIFPTRSSSPTPISLLARLVSSSLINRHGNARRQPADDDDLPSFSPPRRSQ